MVLQLDVEVAELGDRTARTLVVELGEKLSAMMVSFEYVSRNRVPVVESAVQQLAKLYTAQFDHPVNRNLNFMDHFFKEVSHFEEFIPELVKAETDELDQCTQDVPVRARVISEVGGLLQRITEKINETRASAWTTWPSRDGLSWTNDPKIQRYFEHHVSGAAPNQVCS